MLYTMESLKEINYFYDKEHSLNTYDLEKINHLVKKIEELSNKKIPHFGDIVQYTDEYGYYYPKARLTKINYNKYELCEHCSAPFMEIDRLDKLSNYSVSGGAFSSISGKLEFIEKKEVEFETWGHQGACKNGAITFLATVNVWKYSNNKSKYSTKDYDKFIVTKLSDNDEHSIVLNSFEPYGRIYFKTDEEFKKWLKIFHGIEIKRNGNNVIWTYKQSEHFVPLNEYLNIKDCVIDSAFCNGQLQQCKRVYSGTTVSTYFPYQNNAIVIE